MPKARSAPSRSSIVISTAGATARSMQPSRWRRAGRTAAVAGSAASAANRAGKSLEADAEREARSSTFDVRATEEGLRAVAGVDHEVPPEPELCARAKVHHRHDA